MKGWVKVLAGLALVGVCALFSQPVRADDEPAPSKIAFHRIVRKEMIDFALDFFRRRHELEKDTGRDLRKYGYYAKVDLGDDGNPELFLLIYKGSYCGTAGCLTDIFRKTAEGKYEYICGASLIALDDAGPSGGPWVLPNKENGLHLIDDGSEMFHWHSSQKYDSGTLCWSEHIPLP